MQKFWRAFSLSILIIFLFVIGTPRTFSQVAFDTKSSLQITQEITQAQVNSPQKEEITPTIPERQTNSNSNQLNSNEQNFPVVLDGETLFYFNSAIKGIDAKRRAQDISQEIKQVAKNFAISLDSLTIVKLEGVRLISSEEDTVFALVEADARVINRQLDELAEEYLQIAKDAIARYRVKYSRRNIILRIGLVILETIVLAIVLNLLRQLLLQINRHIEAVKSTLFRPINIQNWQFLSIDRQSNLLLSGINLIYWLIVAVIFFTYFYFLTLILPQAKPLEKAISNYLASFFKTAGQATIAFLPNLFSILLTIIIAYYIIRFCRLFFKAIRTGTLSVPGFYRDWARPTQRLTVILIIALAFAIIFPLLPGASSPAFRGISIFVGALFTLGGASTISNLVGGFIIIYTRAFRVGDRVQVEDVVGDILEKTILSTRIRTAKNEIVTIPNANLIASNIKNFTAAYRDINQLLILHTTVTLGYDVPWRKVHQVLIDAALSSPFIHEDPTPFVLQTSLGDFSVSYELNAYTSQPSMMPKIYSQLHQNIQDKCNEAGIEILSPQYSAVRDGNQNTMPEDYLPKDYKVPGFRLDPLSKLFNQPGDRANHQKPPR